MDDQPLDGEKLSGWVRYLFCGTPLYVDYGNNDNGNDVLQLFPNYSLEIMM